MEGSQPAMSFSPVPYVCACGSPEVVAVPSGQLPPEGGRVVNAMSPKAFQEAFGLGARFVLLRWRCINCSSTWWSYLIHQVGRLEDYTPRQLWDFVLLTEITSPVQPRRPSGLLQPRHSSHHRISTPADDFAMHPFSSSEVPPQQGVVGSNDPTMNWLLSDTQGDPPQFEQVSMQTLRTSPMPGHDEDAISNSTERHNRGANFDLPGYRKARIYGACNHHKKLKKKCSCNYRQDDAEQ